MNLKYGKELAITLLASLALVIVVGFLKGKDLGTIDIEQNDEDASIMTTNQILDIELGEQDIIVIHANVTSLGYEEIDIDGTAILESKRILDGKFDVIEELTGSQKTTLYLCKDWYKFYKTLNVLGLNSNYEVKMIATDSVEGKVYDITWLNGGVQ